MREQILIFFVTTKVIWTSPSLSRLKWPWTFIAFILQNLWHCRYRKISKHVCKYSENSPRNSWFYFIFLLLFCHFLFSLLFEFDTYSLLSNNLICIKLLLLCTSNSICWAKSHLLWVLMLHWCSHEQVCLLLLTTFLSQDHVRHVRSPFYVMGITSDSSRETFPLQFPRQVQPESDPWSSSFLRFDISQSSRTHRQLTFSPSLMCKESFLCVSPSWNTHAPSASSVPTFCTSPFS